MPRAAPLALALLLAATGCVVRRPAPTARAVEHTAPVTPLVRVARAPLTVVTYNVHREPGERIAHALREERALREADIVILQEVHRVEPRPGAGGGCSAACALARELGMHAVYAPGHVQDDGTDGVAILARAPITDVEILELPTVSTSLNTIRVIALAATVRVDGAPLAVYAVHLANRITARDRRRQLQPVLTHAAARAAPVVIAGDMNTSPFTWLGGLVPVLTTTQDDHLEALVRRHGFATPVTRSGATSRYLGMRLDAIYTRGLRTLAHGTADGAGLSDHLALWARLAPAAAVRPPATQ